MNFRNSKKRNRNKLVFSGAIVVLACHAVCLPELRDGLIMVDGLGSHKTINEVVILELIPLLLFILHTKGKLWG